MSARIPDMGCSGVVAVLETSTKSTDIIMSEVVADQGVLICMTAVTACMTA